MNKWYPPRWHKTREQYSYRHKTREQYSYQVYSELFGVYKDKVRIRAVALGNRLDENPEIAWQYRLRSGPTARWSDMPNVHTLDEAKATALAIWRMG